MLHGLSWLLISSFQLDRPSPEELQFAKHILVAAALDDMPVGLVPVKNLQILNLSTRLKKLYRIRNFDFAVLCVIGLGLGQKEIDS